MSKFELFDVVELTESLPAFGIPEGSCGTIVDLLASGGYEVEFEALEDELGEMVTAGAWASQLKRHVPHQATKEPEFDEELSYVVCASKLASPVEYHPRRTVNRFAVACNAVRSLTLV